MKPLSNIFEKTVDIKVTLTDNRIPKKIKTANRLMMKRRIFQRFHRRKLYVNEQSI